MNLDIISYKDLFDTRNDSIKDRIQTALCMKGIIGVRDVPHFIEKSRDYLQAARHFSSLGMAIKKQYAPERDAGLTEGYELGAEQFLDQNGQWQRDDKKMSFYAFVPDHKRNKWPREMDLKTPYLALGELMFDTGKKILNFMGLNESIGLPLHNLVGYGRMLHYLAVDEIQNPNWCGAHLDHGVLTALMPAYYFRNGVEVDEPENAGLYIMPSNSEQFEKIDALDKSIMLFQVGEFVQLASNDTIRATKHLVKKTTDSIERFTFALFFSAHDDTVIYSHSELTQDTRYLEHKSSDGSISYGQWEAASYRRYRAL
ncbi:TPA: isopenicillin N synthase family oxygenase [Legionella pneumophila]|nr:isopenicillin N synthase family oxygenase [Legionella pneumophila]HAT2066624.1 isopenicillin N synthase family oxygenase [Legionella pneumophila]HAT8592612.1 hypothetical protein [Legionella pneumophila]HAU1576658.1 isopenicillin N synthase family oxygenase [Legionella pneumophila]HAU1680282.1 isopenicillin N synthase family oxygenase [Legionella pneumophila]HAU3700710.1 isopenicillin N synthase family oxygenase [Legionella pneumophila]